MTRPTSQRTTANALPRDGQPRPCPQCKETCAPGHQYCPQCGFPITEIIAPEEDRFVGTTLPGGHHILDLIGVGGMGRIYRAEQSVLRRTVAVKIVHPHLMADENSAARFLTEARAASQLNHPNSVAVFDFGRTEAGQPYLVMEFLRGKDLAQVAYEEGPLPFSRIVDVLGQVLAALGEAHDLGIVHRDLKPENIILQPLRRGGDFVKVVDFGLAKLRADPKSTSVTSPGIVCGTPDYMSPEQGRGDTIDGRSDLYAVGVILFQLLTGRLPFEAEAPTQVVMMHMSIPAPDPRQVCPKRQIPAALAEVVKKALAKSPAQRYQDAHELAQALRQAVEDLGDDAPPSSSSAFPPSLLVGEHTVCEACGYRVPAARYCCECAAPLPREQSIQMGVPFIGRDDDLAWLEARRPVSAVVQAARIVGEAGAGKTRLLEEFAGRCSVLGDKVFTLGPDPYFAGVSGHTLAEAIRMLARLDQQAIDEEAFPGAAPEAVLGLRDLFGNDRNNYLSPLERRHALSDALRWALVRAASNGRGVPILIIDDLERVDGPSRHAFADVLGEPPPVPALFVCSHVPGFESGWGAERSVARVLEELPAREVRLLVSPQMDLPQRDRFLPLYLDQAMRHQIEGGGQLPGRLVDLIALRIDTLDQDARRILQALAVLGDRAGAEDIAEILQLEPPLDEPVAALVARGMVTQVGSELSTRHPLIREIALAGIPVEVRRELHRRALRLEERKGAPLEVRTQHAYFSQQAFGALLLLEQVADRATARGDTATEVLALRRCLEIARQEISRGELDDPLRAVLIFSRKLGASLTRAGDFADAEGVLREALDLAGPASEDRAKILGALAHVAHGRRRAADALRCLDEAILVAESAGALELASTLADTRRAWSSP
ncbi:MAG: protein kinase [Myxococcales bacterium]|jgi:tRNA A-37 threonylcarbamoyl transferase component Bud32/tetratricopeptide (TPR) repeat protein|nr:protein kinase [Myxococcales bacterium]